MAIKEKGETRYAGQVIRTWDHMWADGMLEEYAVVWDPVEHKSKDIQVGYYGSDGQNLCGGISWEIDFTDEIVRDVVETEKKHGAAAFDEMIERQKHTVLKGDRVRVVRGRKVPKGTELTVFWIGERPDYMGYNTEKIAGCRDDAGNKVWIKYDYLETLEVRPEPTEGQKHKFIEGYVKSQVDSIFGGRVALTGEERKAG